MPVARKKSPAQRPPKAQPAVRGARPRTRSAVHPAADARAASRKSEGAPSGEPSAQILRGLREVTADLQYLQQSFADAQLKLPRADEFEPLVAPLREFARVSPALVDAFRGVIQTTRALIPASRPEATLGGPGLDAARIDEARRLVESARDALRQALEALPRDEDYRPVAAQLRELATVSPSLMEWLREVPKLTTPLSASVAALRHAATDLATASDLLAEDLEAPAPTPPAPTAPAAIPRPR